jgi:hypothetical protein
MLRFFKSFFNKRNEPITEEPHKVEVAPVVDIQQPVVAADVAPQPIKCGCGRSASGFCVGLHKLTAEEWAGHADNPNKVAAPVAEKKPAAKKAPAKKTAPAAKPVAKPVAKPAAITAAPKKPRAKKEAK